MTDHWNNLDVQQLPTVAAGDSPPVPGYILVRKGSTVCRRRNRMLRFKVTMIPNLSHLINKYTEGEFDCDAGMREMIEPACTLGNKSYELVNCGEQSSAFETHTTRFLQYQQSAYIYIKSSANFISNDGFDVARSRLPHHHVFIRFTHVRFPHFNVVVMSPHISVVWFPNVNVAW